MINMGTQVMKMLITKIFRIQRTIEGFGGNPTRRSSKSRACLQAILSLGLLLVCLSGLAVAQSPQVDLTTKDLDELMNIEVTSASRKEEKLFEIPAAVYVITQEDIRRSGLTSIPEILRMVPGLNVARINESTWAISTRGFNHRFANKMLVLIDGRSVYTPLFSGVFWNAQDVVIEDIERIEVIRGPGGTLWGANAVNGIINIITKHARDSQGGLLSLAGGSEERGLNTFRYGGKAGGQMFYRAYVKYLNRHLAIERPTVINGLSYGQANDHSWRQMRGGFRLDWDKSEKDKFSLTGDLYRGSETQKPLYIPGLPLITSNDDERDRNSGGNIVARWNRVLSPTADFNAQFYYDRTFNDNLILDEKRDTYNLEFQHHFVAQKRHDIVLGGGYRYSIGDTQNDGDDWLQINPQRDAFNLFSTFAQDKIALKDKELWLTLGTKLEHYDFAGWQLQPSARLLWMPNAKHSMWASVSRAVRVPSRIERDSTALAAGVPTKEGLIATVRLQGNHDFRSEVLVATEVGYRVQPNNRLYFDFAGFRNSYDYLKTSERGQPIVDFTKRPPTITIPVNYANMMTAVTYGGEIAANASVTPYWKLSGSYSLFSARFRRAPNSVDVNYELVDQSTPKHQFQIRSSLNLKSRFEIDNSLYFVSALTAEKATGDAVQFAGDRAALTILRYTRFDSRFGWQVNKKVNFSFVGQNLFNPSHFEFGSFGQGILSDEIRRAVYGKVTWTF
jgi:iron complex outermembrane recepter protein